MITTNFKMLQDFKFVIRQMHSAY